MRAFLSLGFLVLAAAVLRPLTAQQAPPAASNPEAVIDRHITAVGGRDALRAVRTLMVRGRNVGLGAGESSQLRSCPLSSLTQRAERQPDPPA